MKDIFCQILSMSLSAGILILAIAAVRLWLSRVSRNLTAGLWGIAALRLMFPISLQSRVSLIPEPAVIQPEQMAQTAALQRPVLRPFVPMQEQTAPTAPTVEMLEILAREGRDFSDTECHSPKEYLAHEKIVCHCEPVRTLAWQSASPYLF